MVTCLGSGPEPSTWRDINKPWRWSWVTEPELGIRLHKTNTNTHTHTGTINTITCATPGLWHAVIHTWMKVEMEKVWARCLSYYDKGSPSHIVNSRLSPLAVLLPLISCHYSVISGDDLSLTGCAHTTQHVKARIHDRPETFLELGLCQTPSKFISDYHHTVDSWLHLTGQLNLSQARFTGAFFQPHEGLNISIHF